MNGFMISTQDAPGIAARLLEATAARGVNVFPAYGLADGSTGIISARTTRTGCAARLPTPASRQRPSR